MRISSARRRRSRAAGLRAWRRGAVSAGSEELGGRARAAREAHVGRARTEMRAISAQSRRTATKTGRAVVTDEEWALIGRIGWFAPPLDRSGFYNVSRHSYGRTVPHHP